VTECATYGVPIYAHFENRKPVLTVDANELHDEASNERQSPGELTSRGNQNRQMRTDFDTVQDDYFRHVSSRSPTLENTPPSSPNHGTAPSPRSKHTFRGRRSSRHKAQAGRNRLPKVSKLASETRSIRSRPSGSRNSGRGRHRSVVQTTSPTSLPSTALERSNNPTGFDAQTRSEIVNVLRGEREAQPEDSWCLVGRLKVGR
jgi:hypothetical protein